MDRDSAIAKRGFTSEEAAFYLGVSDSFLRQARMNGQRERHAPSPPYVKVGRMIRYLRDDLDCWLNQYRSTDARPTA